MCCWRRKQVWAAAKRRFSRFRFFRVKEGVNFNPGDPNYDLYRLAIRTSAKRLFPNFSFVDAPFNLQYYKPGHPETEIAYMGCRTRVMGNVYDPDREIAPRRGNLSFTSINLPRIAIEANGNVDVFFKVLQERMELVIDQLNERFRIISNKRVKNFPFLMGEGVWIDSEKLSWNDKVGEVLKHGTMTIGFIGLAEALVALRGKHHGEDEESQKLGLKIIRTMREYTDKVSAETGLNYSVIATPAGRSVRPLHPPRQAALRHHPRRDRPRILHELLPCAGLLPLHGVP